MRRLRRDEAGQSMAEFAIVLPLLLLLTVGTIELAAFLQRQITLSGAGFLAARAATVGGKTGTSPSEAAKEVLGAYAQDSGQPWMKKADLEVESAGPDRAMRIRVVKEGERWAFIPRLDTLGGETLVNREFVQGNGMKSAVQEDSNLIVDYTAELGPLYAAVDGVIDALRGKVQAVPQLASILDFATMRPYQAVEPNPGPVPHTPGKTKAAVYVSSEAEPTLGSVERFAESLERWQLGVRGLQPVLDTLAKDPVNGPLVKLALAGLSSGADAAVRGLAEWDRMVFGARGTP